MKKIALSVLICIFALISCTKENNTTSGNFNQFEYNNLNFKIGNTGTLLYYWDETYVELDLFSSSITYTESNKSFTGIGDAIWFGLYLPDADDIIEGRFEYSNQNLPNNMIHGALNVGLNAGTDYSVFSAIIVSGYVDLKYSEDKEIYTIKFEVGLENGKSVKGNFTGNLQNVYDFSPS